MLISTISGVNSTNLKIGFFYASQFLITDNKSLNMYWNYSGRIFIYLNNPRPEFILLEFVMTQIIIIFLILKIYLL